MNALPWDDNGTMTTAGGDLHARATSLAHAAMEAAASLPVVNPADTDYARSQAEYERRLAVIRSENARRHVEANNARAQAAADRKAERQATHVARNAQMAEAAKQRKIAKAA